MIEVDEAAFLKRIEEPGCAGTFSVRMAGAEISVEANRRKSPHLVITFGGAINQRSHPHPQFGGRRIDLFVPASVVRFADPSLTQSPKLTAAWYAGHEGFETQQILPEFIRRIVSACEVERLIF